LGGKEKGMSFFSGREKGSRPFCGKSVNEVFKGKRESDPLLSFEGGGRKEKRTAV